MTLTRPRSRRCARALKNGGQTIWRVGRTNWARARSPLPLTLWGLKRFLEGEVLPWVQNRKKELANRPLIREQAFGEALDPDKLERLGCYEVHRDRKLERMLSMLLRLKDLRQGTITG
jgi:hypothetical protein